MKGTNKNDTLSGGGGNDSIYGGDGDDLIAGGGGHDVLDGQAGDDTLRGGDGNDYLVGGLGDDVLDGGAAIDWADYADAVSGVTVDLSNLRAQDTVGAGVDRLSGIEQVYGSGFADLLIGDNGANQLAGGAGDDTPRGGLGNDTLVGGDGDDLLIGGPGRAYLDGGAGDDIYQVDVRRSFIAERAGGGLDCVISAVSFRLCENVENLTLTGTARDWGRGNALDNLIAGNDGDNLLLGEGGDDTLRGGGGDDVLGGGDGNDVMDGGAGNDTVLYSSNDCAVTVDLNLAGPQDTGRGWDTLIGIENLTGSLHGDRFVGDGQDNILNGRGGADTLSGGNGADTLQGGAGADFLDGGAGNDVLLGGFGIDTVSYSGASAGVSVNLALKAAQDTGGAGTDRLASIENLIGSAHDDVLGGNLAANVLTGGGGHDRFRWANILHLDGDRISDFSNGDVVDLKAIDADTSQAGDQAFVLVSAFSHHAGEAWVHYASGRHQTLVELDVNGDGVADARLFIDGNHTSHLDFAL